MLAVDVAQWPAANGLGIRLCALSSPLARRRTRRRRSARLKENPVKRTLLAIATSVALAASAVAVAAPASAASTGGYQICGAGKVVGAVVKGIGATVTIKVPGRTTTTYLPSGVVTYVKGTSQVGTWTVSGSYQSASAYCA